MITKCKESDFKQIHDIINDAASAYRGVIPADRWHEPYMSWVPSNRSGIASSVSNLLKHLRKEERHNHVSVSSRNHDFFVNGINAHSVDIESCELVHRYPPAGRDVSIIIDAPDTNGWSR